MILSCLSLHPSLLRLKYSHLSTTFLNSFLTYISPIIDSYIAIDDLLIPHTICFRTLKIHMKCLCIVLCLLILTQCVVDKPAQFHFPFSSCLPGLTLSTLNLIWLDLWDCKYWLNFGIGFFFQIVNWFRESNTPASFQQIGVNGWLSSLVTLPTTGRVFSIV
jgi:hypothetical protein